MSLIQHTTDILAQVVIPDPPAKELPGKLGERANDLVGYAKTIFGVLALLGILACASMLAIGLRGRSDVAKNALSHLPYVLLATVLAGGASGLIAAFA